MNKTTHTYAEIANDYSLWEEFVDISGFTSRAEFNAMTEAEKVAFIEKCFGPESEQE